MIANDPTKAEQNALVLQAIVNLAQTTDCATNATYGSTILFPGRLNVPAEGTNGHDPKGSTYFIAKPPALMLSAAVTIDCNWPLRFLGTGNVRLQMVADSLGDYGDIFDINTENGNDNSGGVTFEDLTFGWQTIEDETSPPPLYAAIHATPSTVQLSNGGGDNIRMIRCIFQPHFPYWRTFMTSSTRAVTATFFRFHAN
jgi:hypothetical protein